MEITKDFAFHVLDCVAMAPTLLIHHGDKDNLGTFPDGFLADGEFIPDEVMALRSISFSPVLAWLTDSMVEGSALRISIVNGFAVFERGSWHWQEDDFKAQDEVMHELAVRDLRLSLACSRCGSSDLIVYLNSWICDSCGFVRFTDA